jgi:cardiolipin synthase
VRVDLLLPWRTDVRIATYAAYAWMTIMHKLGVNVHVIDRMMHGKGVLVDDEWAMVGSSNIDPTSFYDNYEANAVVRDKVAVKELQGTLNQWLEESRRILPEEWAKRGWFMRVQEFIAYWLYRLWHRQY